MIGPQKGTAGKVDHGWEGTLAAGRIRLFPEVERYEAVPEVLPWFYEAYLLVVALRQGAGTRIKVLEAMAAGSPVVSTSKGCEGIAVEDGRELLVADTPERFAQAALEIMNVPDRGKALAQNARRLVLERYTWESAAKVMEDRFHSLVQKAKRG